MIPHLTSWHFCPNTMWVLGHPGTAPLEGLIKATIDEDGHCGCIVCLRYDKKKITLTLLFFQLIPNGYFPEEYEHKLKRFGEPLNLLRDC